MSTINTSGCCQRRIQFTLLYKFSGALFNTCFCLSFDFLINDDKHETNPANKKT